MHICLYLCWAIKKKCNVDAVKLQASVRTTEDKQKMSHTEDTDQTGERITKIVGLLLSSCGLP